MMKKIIACIALLVGVAAHAQITPTIPAYTILGNPTASRAAPSAITSFAGGSSGQYLQKSSNTDFDWAWVGPPLSLAASTTIHLDTSVPGVVTPNVVGLGGVDFTALGTGILWNTTVTGVPSIATNQQVTQAVIPSSVWGSRGSGTYNGQLKLMTDVGATPGTLMQWDGTYWKLLGRTTIYFDNAITSGALSGLLQIGKQYACPAGLLRAGRFVYFAAAGGKSSGGDAWTSFSLKVGTLGTTSDGQIATSSVGANTVLSFGLNAAMLFTTTNVTQTGAANNTTGGFNGQTSTVALNNFSNTISNIDSNIVYFSATYQLAGTASTPSVGGMIVELVP